MFGQRKLLRRSAAQMLLVWLFALTTGIVNACVIEPESRPAALSTLHEHRSGTHMHSLAHDMIAVAHEHPSPQADNPLCAKFCADDSVSAPILKQQSDTPRTVWLAAPPTGSLAVQAALEPVRGHDAERAPKHARVPIPIAFVRLTL